MVFGAHVASASMKVSQTLSARIVAQSLRSHIDRSRGQSNLRNTRRQLSKPALRKQIRRQLQLTYPPRQVCKPNRQRTVSAGQEAPQG